MVAFINSTCLNLLMHYVKVKTTNSRDSQLPRGLSLIECWLVRFILFCQILAPRALGSSVDIYEYFRWTLYYKFSGSGSSHAGCSYPLQSPTWVFWPPNVSQKVFYHSFIPYRYSGVREKAMATMQSGWQGVIICENRTHDTVFSSLLIMFLIFITQDIADLFRGEQNVRRQKPEVWKYLYYLFMQNINIGNFSWPHQDQNWSPQWAAKSERVRAVCGRYRSDFTRDELIDYLRAHVMARPCPLADGMVRIESWFSLMAS